MATKARSTVERALELARSGECADLKQVRQRLKAEHWESIDAHLAMSFARQINRLCAEHAVPSEP